MPKAKRVAEKQHEARENTLPPEPGDLADRAQQASLDPDEPVDVGGDQDIDTAGTDADTSEAEPLKDRARSGDDAPDDN